MCGGFVGDIIDSVGDVIEDVGDFVGDTVEAVVEDPLGAIVSVGAMAMGVPPVWAGALGGAASAAEHGDNILEGALLGGAAGYVGGVAGGAAAEAGAGAALSGAAGGAAAGATGAVLGGGDIAEGILRGGFMGGASGATYEYFNPQTGSTTYTYDDGSTITRGADGSVTSSPSPYQPAPVTDLSTGGTPSGGGGTKVNYNWADQGGGGSPTNLTSTGISDSAPGTIYNGPNGPEIVLESGKTVNLLDYQHAVAQGGNITIDGMTQAADAPYRVEVGGLPGTAENPSYAKPDQMNPNTRLATFDEIDAGKATWNPAANAWEMGAELPTTTIGGEDGIPSSYVAPVTVNPDGSTTTVNWNGTVTTTFTDGTSVTSNPDGTSVTRDATGNTHVVDAGQGSGGGINMGNGDTTYVYDDGSSITLHADGTSTSTPAPGENLPGATNTGGTSAETPLKPLEPVDVASTPVTNVDVTTPVDTTPADGTIPYNPGGWTPTVVTPVFPVTTPKTPTTPTTPPPSVTVSPEGPLPDLQIPTGLNPGWIAPTPFYHTTSPVQSQYFWGAHPYQVGPTFDSASWNAAPGAPATPWGLQEMAPVARPQDIVNYINSPEYQSQFVSGPVVPGR